MQSLIDFIFRAEFFVHEQVEIWIESKVDHDS